ncbi:MAG: hypothetical protein MO853_01990 [Candidatus Protistobacter heckmanni]|nr:hypothetical protein [Candidatus Protistobacter heckmanni]
MLLAVGGGILQVGLSGGFFQTIHDWMPFSWVVKAFRASLFGAYANGWLQAWAVVVLAGGLCMLTAGLVCRWRVVPHHEYRPSIETSESGQ